jgi:hypothetical protein
MMDGSFCEYFRATILLDRRVMLIKSIGAAIIAAIVFPVLSIAIYMALIATHQQVPFEPRITHFEKTIALNPAPLRATAAPSRHDHAAGSGLK